MKMQKEETKTRGGVRLGGVMVDMNQVLVIV